MEGPKNILAFISIMDYFCGTTDLDTSGIKWPQKKTGKTENLRLGFLISWSPFLDSGDMSIFREKACNAM